MKNAVFWDVIPCGSCKNWFSEGHTKSQLRRRESLLHLDLQFMGNYNSYPYSSFSYYYYTPRSISWTSASIQCLNAIYSRQYSLYWGSACCKAAPYTQDNINIQQTHTDILTLRGIQSHERVCILMGMTGFVFVVQRPVFKICKKHNVPVAVSRPRPQVEPPHLGRESLALPDWPN
jgi:hypothetical protein